jgi:hypothetical protein
LRLGGCERIRQNTLGEDRRGSSVGGGDATVSSCSHEVFVAEIVSDLFQL